jgi:hypothetical protein
MFAALNSFLTRAVTGYFLNKSLRFRSSASAYLGRTPSVAGNRTVWTWSGWVKRGTLGVNQEFFSAGLLGANTSDIFFDVNDKLNVINYVGAVYKTNKVSNAVFRDPAAWYHIVISANGATSVDVSVNGVALTWGTSVGPDGTNWFFNATNAHVLGTYVAVSAYYFDGELAEVNFVDGQALAPTAFGAYSTYNQWLPIRYAGTYGTNGFYLPFTNTTSTSTLVADSSGNGNNWTPNNISLTAGSTYDSLTDVPTLTSTTVANYAVLNPINPKGNSTVSNGNLTEVITTVTGAGRGTTIAVTSGKFYVEATAIGAGAMVTVVGITSPSASTYQLYLAGVGYYSNSGNKYISGVASAYGTAWSTAGTYVIGMALDVGAGTLQFYLNNVAQGSITLPATPSDGWIFLADWESSGGSVTYNWNYGQQPFVYTAPTGFLPLNTYNI